MSDLSHAVAFPSLSRDLIENRRVALAIAYNGNHYHGWQSQADPYFPTVQDSVEKALSAIAAEDIKVHCAGRTDRGVHGTYQVVHFDSNVKRSEKAWVMGGNTHLPPDVSISWARGVADDFHARFSATARTYRYLIYNAPLRSASAAGLYSFCRTPLDHQLMHEEAQSLLGERDFSSFRGAGCQSNTPFRFMERISVTRHGSVVAIELKANAFLLHMVRNIAGVLMAVGSGVRPKGWTAEVIAAQDRTKAGVTAAPDGLYLVDVDYPEQYQLPLSDKGPVFYPL
jgi:tRNA pseudouridine38-40 synthase